MDRLLIARQLQAALRQLLSHELEIERLLGDAHYTRDVLLVCDALRNGALSALAAQFRAASAGPGHGMAAMAEPAAVHDAALRRLWAGWPDR